jgi:hypothetical protein
MVNGRNRATDQENTFMTENQAPLFAIDEATDRFVRALWAAMGESLYSAEAPRILAHLKRYNIGAYNQILCFGFDVDVLPERCLSETAPEDEFFVSTAPGFQEHVRIRDRITSLAQGYCLASERFGLEALYAESIAMPA